MERRRALLAACLVAGMLLTGGVVFAAPSVITNSRVDNIGQLQPTGNEPTTTTLVVDPTTGAKQVSHTVPSAPAELNSRQRAYLEEVRDD